MKMSRDIFWSLRFPGIAIFMLFTHTVPCICCISKAPCSMGLGAMMVVCEAWLRLTIRGGGAVWGATGMVLGKKYTQESNMSYYLKIHILTQICS